MSRMNFTEEQTEAIHKDGTNIIVSAGAGSGKTAVLSERVIRKLKDGVNINELLILTFTNEAASEMKNRIRKKIIKNNLFDQATLLESSYITTFDSFALSLVKKYHYLLNVSRDIKVADSGIIKIYKKKIIDQLFEEKYGTKLFDKLINDFCLKDDRSIKDFIIDISNRLDLLTNKEEYINNYIDSFYSEENLNMLLGDYLKLIRNKIMILEDTYHKFLSFADSKLVSKLDEWFKLLFNGNEYKDYVLFNSYPPVAFRGVREGGEILKNELKKEIDEIKKLLRFKDLDEIKDSIIKTRDYVIVSLDIVNELDNQLKIFKINNNLYEFNDISKMALSLVRDNIDIRYEVRDSFNEIMVDEYQDTSSIQEEFISYISNNNVYMVGDIKQSIYRFRNANPYIFKDKYDKYSKNIGGYKIDLLKNFRSREETIFNINEIFNLVMDEDIGDANYLDSHNMIADNKAYLKEDSKHNNYMEIYNYSILDEPLFSKEEKELFIIADDIIDKINNGYLVMDKETEELRKLTYSDICIITDRNKYLEKYKKILEYKGIPSVIYMNQKLNQDMIILVLKNLINLVWLVNNKIFDNKFRYLYTSIARSFLFSYQDDLIYNNIKDKSYFDSEILKKCYNINVYNPLLEVINDIICEFNVYQKLVILPDIDANMIRIDNLLDIANNLNLIGYGIDDFINYLDDMNDMELDIEYKVNTGNSDAVKIMNIHKSKGLEFSLCYFTGMYNPFNIREIKTNYLISNKYGIIYPYVSDDGNIEGTILKDLYREDYVKDEISEKIRLFYVALTRAREKMIILANINEDDDKYNHIVPYNVRIKFRSFLDILNSLKICNKYIINKSSKYTKDYDKINIRSISVQKNDMIIKKKDINIDYKKIDNYHFSKESNILNINSDSRKMLYGTSIHKIFEFDDFNNPKHEYVINLLDKIPNNYQSIYREYEFIYEKDGNRYKGVIDLMVEYEKVIYIIDYKLKNIDDIEYVKQLKGYYEYIKTITNKTIKCYLYSVLDNILMEVGNE